MRWLASIAFGVMHAACSDSKSTPDALVADASTGGLIVELVAKGGVPQMPTANVEITKVVIGLKSLRAIGDAAPGDMRTTRTDPKEHLAPLEWHEGHIPIPNLFSQAPPGVYSSIELEVSSSTQSTAAVEVRGRAARGGNIVPFEIQNLGARVPIAVEVSTVLLPRAFATASIELDVAALIAAIDWDAVPLTTDGRLYITDGDPQMGNVIAAVATAFAQR